jgi:hypothetical protein
MCLHNDRSAKIAYQCSVEYEIKIPDIWNRNKYNDPYCFAGFLKTNSALSIKQLEATRLARITSFKKKDIKIFW